MKLTNSLGMDDRVVRKSAGKLIALVVKLTGTPVCVLHKVQLSKAGRLTRPTDRPFHLQNKHKDN